MTNSPLSPIDIYNQFRDNEQRNLNNSSAIVDNFKTYKSDIGKINEIIVTSLEKVKKINNDIAILEQDREKNIEKILKLENERGKEFEKQEQAKEKALEAYKKYVNSITKERDLRSTIFKIRQKENEDAIEAAKKEYEFKESEVEALQKIGATQKQIDTAEQDSTKAKEKLVKLEKDRVKLLEIDRKARIEQLGFEKRLADYKERVAKRAEAYQENELEYKRSLAILEEKRKKNEDGKSQEDLQTWYDTEKKKIEDDFKKNNLRDDQAFGVKGERGIGYAVSAMKGIFDKDQGGGLLSIIAGDKGEIANIFTSAMSTVPWFGLVAKLLKGISDTVSTLSKTVGQGIETYSTIQDEYLANINSKLNAWDGAGTETPFGKIFGQLQDTFGNSKYFSMKSLMEKVNEIATAGIASNIEQKTIISELATRLVTTFNILDDTLVRLTKIQEQDYSGLELGAQQALTDFLTETFGYSDYMNDLYSSVASTLIDATSQMDIDTATQFSYAVQKWLGSLYSKGMSSEGVTALAGGIAALATGDYESFNGNDGLLNLFALSSGSSFGNLLTTGLSADNIDELLNNIVTYLANISGDTNQVLKQAKAGVYGGLTISDIMATSNLTSSQLNSIRSTAFGASNYNLSTLLDMYSANSSYVSQYNNLVDNFMVSLGESVLEGVGSLYESDSAVIDTNTEDGYKMMNGKYYRVVSTKGGMEQNLVEISEDDYIAGTGSMQANSKASNGAKKYLWWKLSEATGSDAIQKMVQSWITVESLGSLLDNVAASAAEVANNGPIDLGVYSDLASFSNNTRGSTILGGQLTGITSGVSSSTSYSSSASNGLVASLYGQARTVGAAGTTYSSGTQTLARDVSDLYRALFEEKIPMKVILSKIEASAQAELSAPVFRTSEESTSPLVNRVESNTSTLGSKLDAIHNSQNHLSNSL